MNVKGFLNDYTALHYAAYNGHTTCAQALLRAGARCTVVNKYDETPAQSAHSRGHSHIEKGIQRWLLSNPESKQTSGVSSALEGHTRKGQGLTKSSGGDIDVKNAGSSNGSKSSKKKKRKKEKEKKKKTETATSGANLLPQLEAATARITLALKEESQQSFDSTARKSLKKLLKELHGHTEGMDHGVAHSSGIVQAVEKLATHHANDKVQKWANGLVDVWTKKFQVVEEVLEEASSSSSATSGKRRSSELEESGEEGKVLLEPKLKRSRT